MYVAVLLTHSPLKSLTFLRCFFLLNGWRVLFIACIFLSNFSFSFLRMHFINFDLFQSTSGVSVNPDVQRSFQRLSDSKEYRYILFKIEVRTFFSKPSFHKIGLLRYCLYYHQEVWCYQEISFVEVLKKFSVHWLWEMNIRK